MSSLQLVTQPLLMPVRFHALAALVLGNFGFPSFFKRAHSDFETAVRIEPSNSPQRKSGRAAFIPPVSAWQAGVLVQADVCQWPGTLSAFL
jgi:hypothetical protein